MSIAQVNPSTATANGVLVPAVAGKLVKVRNIFFSSDTTMIVSLENSTTHATFLIKQYVIASGGLALGEAQLGEAYWSNPGEGVDYTTSAVGNVFIKIQYEQV